MNYEKSTDFEIEKAVAILWLDCDYWFDEGDKTVYLVEIQHDFDVHGVPDVKLKKCGEFKPLTNASDSFPIIQSAKISLIKTDDDCWTAFEWENDDNERWHKNPLRAAMITYLEMNKDKK